MKQSLEASKFNLGRRGQLSIITECKFVIDLTELTGVHAPAPWVYTTEHTELPPCPLASISRIGRWGGSKQSVALKDYQAKRNRTDHLHFKLESTLKGIMSYNKGWLSEIERD